MNPNIIQFTDGSKFRGKQCQTARHHANFRGGSAQIEGTYSLKPSFRETTEINGLDKPIKRTIAVIFLWIFFTFLILFLQVIKYYSCRGEGELNMGCWKRELASGLLCCLQEGENSPLPPKGNKTT